MCLILTALPAMAQDYLSARIDGNVLRVTWDAACGGNCVLSVYQNGWPISVTHVSGADGAASVNLGTASGTYTIRLTTDKGCMATDVRAEVSTTPKPQAPAVNPTKKPNAIAATPKPVAQATPKPTQAAGAINNGSLAEQVVAQVNAERAKQGLSALRVDAELTRAACVRAAEITQKFSHTRPDGSAWSTVSGSAYGENIAMGQRTADKVMAAWMTSEGHRANILRASYGSIGVCAYIYNGVTYWVQLFGK